ncbi:sugar phosphate isomerase/epimerase family protein [Archaeoglobus veneficus]|nr:sugar phosphate isomerase/epimerase [Archaeoglobus veneficus]
MKVELGIQPDIAHKPKEAFEFAANNGFSHIELLMDHPYYSLENLSYAEVLELKGSYDLEVLLHAPATSTNFISTSSLMRKASYAELERTMSFAERCEAKLVTVHIGWNPGFITARGFVFQEEIYSRHNYEVLTREFYAFAKYYGEMLAIENTIRFDESLSRALEFLLENTDVALTFDIGHYYAKGDHDVFLRHFDRVRNIHLHDNNGEIDSHLPLGHGNVDLSIIPNSYEGYATIEVRDEEAILESKRYFEEWTKKCKKDERNERA